MAIARARLVTRALRRCGPANPYCVFVASVLKKQKKSKTLAEARASLKAAAEAWNALPANKKTSFQAAAKRNAAARVALRSKLETTSAIGLFNKTQKIKAGNVVAYMRQLAKAWTAAPAAKKQALQQQAEKANAAADNLLAKLRK